MIMMTSADVISCWLCSAIIPCQLRQKRGMGGGGNGMKVLVNGIRVWGSGSDRPLDALLRGRGQPQCAAPEQHPYHVRLLQPRAGVLPGNTPLPIPHPLPSSFGRSPWELTPLLFFSLGHVRPALAPSVCGGGGGGRVLVLCCADGEGGTQLPSRSNGHASAAPPHSQGAQRGWKGAWGWGRGWGGFLWESETGS